MSFTNSSINFLQSEKKWISIPFYIRKYHHLWNLLNRSSIYASALLSLIQSKEKRKKRKYAAKQKQKSAKLIYKKFNHSQRDDAKFILEKVIGEVVKAVNFTTDNSINLFENNFFNNDNSICQLSSIRAEESFFDFANQSNVDSAYGESSFLSENQSCDVDFDDSYNASSEKTFWSESDDTFLCNMEYPNVGNDQEYVLSLKQRRKNSSSPQYQTETNVLCNANQNKKVIENKNDCDGIFDNDYFLNASLDFEHTSNLLLPIIQNINNKKEKFQNFLSNQKVSKSVGYCVVELCNSSRYTNILPKKSNFLKNVNINCKTEKVQYTGGNSSVSCPICNKAVSEKNINFHLDICTGTVSKRKSLRSSNLEYSETKKKIDDCGTSKCYMETVVKENIEINEKSSGENKLSAPIKKIDNEDKLHVMSSGVEKLKYALKGAIANTAAVKDLVVQSAAADKQLSNDQNQLSDCNYFINALKNSPVFNDSSGLSRFKINFQTKHSESNDNDSDFDEKSIEQTCSTIPTRRSTRSKDTRKSYCEISSSDNENDYHYLEPICQPKKKKIKKEAIKIENDESYTNAICSNEKKESPFPTETFCESEYESENNGLSEVEIKNLLAKKLYLPNPSEATFLREDEFGIRYYNQEPVDPAQPKYFTGGALREYQIAGYQWLKLMHENGVNGILADEMGLGKTIQCVALICKLVKSRDKGPFLVCGPTSTINNWMSEFKRFAPNISLLLYHGSLDERSVLKQELMEKVKSSREIVVITSYEILLRDKTALSSFCWTYWILDEAHRVKNLQSKTFRELKDFPASSKLMLSGTPLQNNVSELWSLLNFILPEVFDDIQAFDSWFGIESLQKNEKLLAMLHQILTPFVLRRVKTEVEVKIPPKREILVSAPLGSLQEKYYRATVDRSIVQLIKNKEYYDVTPGVANPELGCLHEEESEQEQRWTRSKLKETKFGKDKYNDGDYAIHITLNNMMMQLRRCCNHPYLIQFPLECGTEDLLVDESIVTTCGKMMLLDRMLPALKKEGHKIKSFNDDPDIFIFLLSTRAGGLGINLTAADTVIIYDSDWNPHNDIQAQDRCHRIGQKRPVVVYRLVTMGTIDQQVVERAAKKRKLEKMVMHQEKFKGHLASELKNFNMTSTEELLKILESTSDIHVVDNQESVITDSDLRQLLDRSNMMDAPRPIDPSSPVVNSSPMQSSNVVTFKIIEDTSETRICA